MPDFCRTVSALVVFSLALSAPAFAFSSKPPGSDPGTASVWVTRSDGSQSCSIKEGQSVEAGANDLKAAGIPVLNAQKSSDAKMHIQMCGAPTGALNSYRIRRADLPKALALGFREAGGDGASSR